MRELVTVEPTGDSVVRTLSSYGATSNISLTLDAGGEEALPGEHSLAFVSTDSGTTIIDTASGGTAGSTTGYVRAVLENNDLPTYGGGLRTCWSDDPNSPFYTQCGGRKDEPQWSKPVSEGGKGMVDWKHPRPEPFDCGPPPPWWKFW